MKIFWLILLFVVIVMASIIWGGRNSEVIKGIVSWLKGKKNIEPEIKSNQRKQDKPDDFQFDLKRIQENIAKLQTENSNLKGEFSNLQRQVGDFFSVKKELTDVTNRVDAITKFLQQQNAQQKTSTQESQEIHHLASKSEFWPQTLYASGIDNLYPAGFNINNLKKTEEKAVFKIVMDNRFEGIFEIVDNFEMHQVLLAAFNPLVSATSEYSTIPLDPNDIATEVIGKVRREGDMLVIVKKQTVRIV